MKPLTGNITNYTLNGIIDIMRQILKNRKRRRNLKLYYDTPIIKENILRALTSLREILKDFNNFSIHELSKKRFQTTCKRRITTHAEHSLFYWKENQIISQVAKFDWVSWVNGVSGTLDFNRFQELTDFIVVILSLSLLLTLTGRVKYRWHFRFALGWLYRLPRHLIHC